MPIAQPRQAKKHPTDSLADPGDCRQRSPTFRRNQGEEASTRQEKAMLAIFPIGSDPAATCRAALSAAECAQAALIEELASTTVLNPDDVLEVDAFGNFLIAIGGKSYP